MSVPPHPSSSHRSRVGRVTDFASRHQVLTVVVASAALSSVALLRAVLGGIGHTHARVAGVDWDALLQMWSLSVTPNLLLHGHSPFFTDWLNVPGGVNLVTNTAIPLLGLIAAPLTLTAGPVAAFNALVVVGFAGSTAAAFVAFRRWTPWPPAAYVGALVYGFSPYMVAQGTMHLNLEFMVIPPLIMVVLDEILIRQRRHAALTGLLLGLLAAAQFLTSSEVLVYATIFAIIGTTLLMLAYRGEVVSRARYAASALGVAAVSFVVICGYPVWTFFAGPQHISGPSHARQLLDTLVADPAQLVSPGAGQLLGQGALGRLFGVAADPWEGSGYLGLSLTIALVAICVRYRRLPVVRLMATLAMTGLILSWGTHLAFNGHTTGIPLPFAALVRLPLLNNLAAVRFTGFVALFAGALLAIGLDRFHATHFDGRTVPMRPRLVAFAAIVGVLAPLTPNWPYPTVPNGTPPFFASSAFQRIPAGSVVLTYPFPRRQQAQPMLWQAFNKFRYRLVGGYILVPGPTGKATEGPAGSNETSRLFMSCLTHPGVARVLSPGEITAVRAELAAWNVDSVVLVPASADQPSLACPESVMALALGAPPRRDAGALVWFNAQRSLTRVRSAT